jgi:hypothetical protein
VWEDPMELIIIESFIDNVSRLPSQWSFL